MTYAIGIVAHPKRAEQAHHLAATVNANIIVMDTDSHGERWCHQQTLTELRKHDADWYVMLEDDAIPCDNFNTILTDYLTEAEPAIVSLYLGTGAWADDNAISVAHMLPTLTAQADAEDAHWIQAGSLWHAVGVAIPRSWARRIIHYLQRHPHATDKAISQWARTNHVPVRYTWPSLVDHADSERLTGEPHPAQRKAWKTRPL